MTICGTYFQFVQDEETYHWDTVAKIWCMILGVVILEKFWVGRLEGV